MGCDGSEWLMTLVGELGAQVLLMKSSMLPPSCNAHPQRPEGQGPDGSRWKYSAWIPV